MNEGKSGSAEDRQRNRNCLCGNGYLDVLWIFEQGDYSEVFSIGEYGVFNLALTVLSIALVVATLGFQNALPFIWRKSLRELGNLISTALVIVALNNIIWMIIYS